MCPACLASAAVVAGSALSTGGIAALAVKLVGGKRIAKTDGSKKLTERRNDDGNHERNHPEPTNDARSNDERGNDERGND